MDLTAAARWRSSSLGRSDKDNKDADKMGEEGDEDVARAGAFMRFDRARHIP